jgi:glycosyltransferase involved in cell wall biosynthesis
MKAAIYNPYLDTLGGGERYTIAVATTLAKFGYRVVIEWSDPSIKEKIQNRFGIKLENIEFSQSVNRGDGYDLCFWVSDGSIPTLRSRKNILHFQIPFTNVKGKSLLNKMKLLRIKKIICNSNFTKKFIDKEYGVNSAVLYPPIDIKNITPKRKENIILNVARFSKLKQAKRHDVLIESFKNLKNIGNWKLILAGGTEVGTGDYLDKLIEKSKNYPITFLENASFKEIKNLYGKAKIFWSASGYGIDDEKNPEKMEHFGITIVEAMSGGAVPIVYNGGGHKEIIKNGVNGYLWETKEALVKATDIIIKDTKVWNILSKNANIDSQKFGYERFEKELLELL